MKIAEIQFSPWDKKYWFRPGDIDLKMKDVVLVRTEIGLELGEVVGFVEVSDEKAESMDLKEVQSKASQADIDACQAKLKNKEKVIDQCRDLVRKHNLEMKVVDVHFSFDDKRVTFAFIADGRVDFRQLVRDITKQMQKTVRFHQIGVRDEAKINGEYGACGKQLCCKQFLHNLGQVTGDFADTQQITHRGSERLSGPCARLKCCLRYEQDMYEELGKDLPNVGRRVRTDQGAGVVVEKCVLKGSVKVRLDGKDRTYIEVDIRNKKKDK